VLGDAGYWHKQQSENIVSDGAEVLVPPDSGLRKGPRPESDKGMYALIADAGARPRMAARVLWVRSCSASSRASSNRPRPSGVDGPDSLMLSVTATVRRASRAAHPCGGRRRRYAYQKQSGGVLDYTNIRSERGPRMATAKQMASTKC
jgi:hypothetical protein